jgi:hypothetical protein
VQIAVKQYRDGTGAGHLWPGLEHAKVYAADGPVALGVICGFGDRTATVTHVAKHRVETCTNPTISAVADHPKQPWHAVRLPSENSRLRNLPATPAPARRRGVAV